MKNLEKGDFMAEPVIAEIFIIGNEILIDEIQDINTHWLCREINGIGGRVERGMTSASAIERNKAMARHIKRNISSLT
jgi:molybdopterin-biosynthesis enzyme MoeA-like protein